ncbi:MAG TPA: flippase-like domain-containing protein [Thermoplasmatales archaeon]|nr:flippase-like domain-containing protein [Thermoplasmatales archaeon]
MDKRVVARVLISAGLLALLIYRTGIVAIGEILAGVILLLFLLAVIVENMGVALSAKKWQMFLESRGIQLSYRESLSYYYIGSFFNTMMPSSVGGDIIKSYKLGKKTDSVGAFSSSIMDRMMGLLAVVSIASVAVVISYGILPRAALLAAVAVISGFAGTVVILMKTSLVERFTTLVFSRWATIHAFLMKVISSVKGYRDKKLILTAMVISFLYHIMLILNNYLLSLALGMNIDIRYFFIFIPIAEILVSLPVSIQGFGVREGSYALLFSSIGAEYAAAFSLGFLDQIVKVITSMIGGVVYVIKK